MLKIRVCLNFRVGKIDNKSIQGGNKLGRSAKIDENEAKEEHENNKKVRLEKIQNIQNK